MQFTFIKLKALLVDILWKLSFIIPDKYFLIKFRGGKIYLNLRESPMMLQRAFGVYEPYKFKLFSNLVKKNMTVIDVGANKGCFSLLSAKLMGDCGRVLSFEPEPENCSWILRSIKVNNYKSISLFQLALSDSDGTAELYIGEKSGFHSLLPQLDKPKPEKMTVIQKRLDTVLSENKISKVDLIKIDVEGAELQVLKGAVEIIKQNNNLKIILDLHPQKGVDIYEIYDFLLKYGYKLYRIGKEITPIKDTDQNIKELVAIKEGFYE